MKIGYELYARGADRIAAQSIQIIESAQKFAVSIRENKVSKATKLKKFKELVKWVKMVNTELELLNVDFNNIDQNSYTK